MKENEKMQELFTTLNELGYEIIKTEKTNKAPTLENLTPDITVVLEVRLKN